MADEVPAPLQFDKAELPELGAPTCAACQGRITEAYYEVNGNTACGRCKQLLAGGAAEDPLALARATGLGLGAAAVSGTGWYLLGEASDGGGTWGIVALAVGWLVGRAVLKGAGGVGGRKYQALAVGLTYLSVAGSHLPAVVAGFTGRGAGEFSFVAAALQLLAAPFASTGPFGYLLIGLGLWEAYRVNSPVALQITGPYQLGTAPRGTGG